MLSYQNLAIAEEESKLLEAVNTSRNLLIEAPTGSGKSLYLPYFLENHFSGKIVVLQPRRIAALALAEFSAKLHREPCGKTIGYQFRQESCRSDATRILFQTYGNFLQEILHGKLDAEWVIFDEYHERKSDMDLLFSYLTTLKNGPRLIVMSAKLNREEKEKALGVKCLELGHPLYPVQVLHQDPATGTTLETEVVRALRTLYRNNIWQTTLVFLPGKGEIAKCHTAAMEALGPNVAQMFELYAGQSREIQNQIFEETESPRIIFTTNIAETSITVPGVTGVIDSGVERISEYDDAQRINVLRTVQISKQNSIQRAGRAGRTQNGVCIQLWNEATDKRMPAGIIPEVTQIEPSEFILQKAALEYHLQKNALANDDANWGAKNEPNTLQLPTAIPAAREQAALAKLNRLKMLAQANITELGLKAVQSPISDVSLSQILFSGEPLSCLTLMAMAWIHSGTESLQKNKNPVNLITLAEDSLSDRTALPREVQWTFRQLKDYCKEKGLAISADATQATKTALLQAYPDCLATTAGTNGNTVTYKLSNQNAIRLQTDEPPYAILAIQMLRTGTASKVELRLNLYVPLEENLLNNGTKETHYELLWRNGQERFIGIEVTPFSRKEILPQEASPKVLNALKELTATAWKEKLEKENWNGRFQTEAVQTLLIKMRLAAKLYPEFGLPEFNEEDMALILEDFVSGVFMLRDISEDRYRAILEDYFGKSMLPWLAKTFPDHYQLPNGKRARYSYQAVAAPEGDTGETAGNCRGQIAQSAAGVLVEISARIEDLMELRGEHFIADKKLKVRYDILAPNFRTIQKTWDLTGFWENTYPEVRKELRGRYPKHPWPEKVI